MALLGPTFLFGGATIGSGDGLLEGGGRSRISNRWVGRVGRRGGGFGLCRRRSSLWLRRVRGSWLWSWRLNFPNAPKAARASDSTFVIGHLVIQVVTVHHEPEHENARVEGVTIQDGEWDKLLLRIWPVGTHPVTWPPQATFRKAGTNSIATLQNRWKMGKDATI